MDASASVGASSNATAQPPQYTTALSGTAASAPVLSSRSTLYPDGRRILRDEEDTSSDEEKSPVPTGSLPPLMPKTTAAEMALYLNDELGMHPLLTAHMIDAWDALDANRLMAQLIRKFSERLAGASFVAELESVGPDTLRSMLLAQMKVLF